MAKGKFLISIVTALYLSTSVQASANDGGAIVGGLLGIFAGAVAADMARKNQRAHERQQYRQQKNAELIAARAEVQRRLNDLGFNAGYPDGVYGPQTRQAIAAFQDSIGANSDGKITKDQIAILYEKSDQGYAQQQYANNEPQTQPTYGQQNAAPAIGYNAPAQAYVQPQSQAQALTSEAWEEPEAPIAQQNGTGGTATAYVDPANPQYAQAGQAGAQAWEEPDAPGTTSSAPTASTQPVANPVDGVMNTIAEAVCNDNSALFESVRSFVQANVVTKEQVSKKIRETYPTCVVRGYKNSLKMLVEFEGMDATFPIWLVSTDYHHGDSTYMSFDHAAIRSKDSSYVLMTANYAQLSIHLNSYMYYNRPDSDVNRILEQNVNKRDCLGYPPLYYAATNKNWDMIKWLIEKGANPNLIVPYTVRDVGFLEEAVEKSIPITTIGNNSKGYGLKSQYSCVDNGPSAALMNSYKSNNELVPLWTFLARALSTNETSDSNAYFLSRVMPMVPSVPRTTIPDLMDLSEWRPNVNYQQHLDIVKAFVAKGADINAPTREDGTPIKIWVAHQIQPNALQQLLAIGARM
ncbi:peptidoglycan-binding protein [Pleomorphomonas sp. JP5]|uniref:peptidoglycan-binding protein n=1 Tax=Pleomorphomonas sp. JP5 TaxID=2942998 RepID=UPI0020448526|nr:peptidoglycan-binding protein [Pleomorphomonas sp. JP5]MCM5560290.1 peptidoglycan-binding protein [Pleomorphomonas sp. JP5]